MAACSHCPYHDAVLELPGTRGVTMEAQLGQKLSAGSRIRQKRLYPIRLSLHLALASLCILTLGILTVVW